VADSHSSIFSLEGLFSVFFIGCLGFQRRHANILILFRRSLFPFIYRAVSQGQIAL